MKVGEQHPESKLTEEQVVEMREDAADGATHRELAARFGLSRSTVGAIVRGEMWRHAPGPRTKTLRSVEESSDG